MKEIIKFSVFAGMSILGMCVSHYIPKQWFWYWVIFSLFLGHIANHYIYKKRSTSNDDPKPNTDEPPSTDKPIFNEADFNIRHYPCSGIYMPMYQNQYMRKENFSHIIRLEKDVLFGIGCGDLQTAHIHIERFISQNFEILLLDIPYDIKEYSFDSDVKKDG